MDGTPGGRRVRARLELVARARDRHEPSWLLEEALADDVEVVREHATRAAAEVFLPEELVDLGLRGDSERRRAAAIEALLDMGSRAMPTLLAGARAEDPATALLCVEVLGRMRSNEAVQTLRERARASNPLIAEAAMRALERYTNRSRG